MSICLLITIQKLPLASSSAASILVISTVHVNFPSSLSLRLLVQLVGVDEVVGSFQSDPVLVLS